MTLEQRCLRMFEELTGVEMALHIERTLGLLSILGIFLITSCVDMREAVSEESDAEKNLAAIRELLKPAGDRGPTQSRRSGGETSGDRHEGVHTVNEVSSSDVGSARLNCIPLSSQFKASSNGGIHSGHPPLYIPWRPSDSNASGIAEPFRPVPPYFIIMPAVPGSLGPARCSPDFSGGQRCH